MPSALWVWNRPENDDYDLSTLAKLRTQLSEAFHSKARNLQKITDEVVAFMQFLMIQATLDDTRGKN